MKSQVKDHLGQDFESIQAMCNHYGIHRSCYESRLRKGWSKEKALTTNSRLFSKMKVTYKGVTYNSIDDLCELHNISKALVKQRLTKGWTLERALTNDYKKRITTVSDHKGNVFPTVQAMCDHYGIGHSTYYRNIKLMPLNEVLEGSGGHSVSDHKGNVFVSVREMCKHYGVRYNVYYHRREKGYSLEEALTIPNGSSKSRVCFDHLGKQYASQSEMCRAYGIRHNTFMFRVANGWSLEEALTSKATYARFVDPLGKGHTSLKAGLRFYNIDFKDFFKYKVKCANDEQQAFKMVLEEKGLC